MVDNKMCLECLCYIAILVCMGRKPPEDLIVNPPWEHTREWFLSCARKRGSPRECRPGQRGKVGSRDCIRTMNDMFRHYIPIRWIVQARVLRRKEEGWKAWSSFVFEEGVALNIH